MVGYIKDINELFRKDLLRVLDDTLFEPTKEEAIDFYNRFVGKIIDNNDPDKLGRCKVRVFGLFGNEIPDQDLPWATPDFNFIGSTKGSFIIPPIGNLVNIYFHKGDIYQPHYTTKVINSNSLPKRRMKNYPNNQVFFENDDGSYFEYDNKNGTTNFNHKSGTKITIYSDGSIIIDCKGSNFSAKGANNCEIFGKESTNLGGNFPVLYSTNGLPPTDAEGRPLQGIAVSNSVTVGL